MSGWLNLCNTVPDSSRPGNRPILKFTKYVYQVLTYYKAGRNLSETRLSLDVCRDKLQSYLVLASYHPRELLQTQGENTIWRFHANTDLKKKPKSWGALRGEIFWGASGSCIWPELMLFHTRLSGAELRARAETRKVPWWEKTRKYGWWIIGKDTPLKLTNAP